MCIHVYMQCSMCIFASRTYERVCVSVCPALSCFSLSFTPINHSVNLQLPWSGQASPGFDSSLPRTDAALLKACGRALLQPAAGRFCRDHVFIIPLLIFVLSPFPSSFSLFLSRSHLRLFSFLSVRSLPSLSLRDPLDVLCRNQSLPRTSLTSSAVQMPIKLTSAQPHITIQSYGVTETCPSETISSRRTRRFKGHKFYGIQS